MKYFISSFSCFRWSKKGCVSNGIKQRYVHEVLANPLVKLDQKKCDCLTDYPDMSIAGT